MLIDDGHEIGNHSSYHLMDIQPDGDDWKITNFDGTSYTKNEWREKEFQNCHNFLTADSSLTDSSKGMGLSSENIYGWRTPRLEWNDAILELLEENNYLYDCSMELGLESGSDGRDFYWPHTLHNGSPEFESVKSHNLWEFPAYPFVIPPHLRGDDKVGASIMTGLDFNVWAPKEWGALELTSDDMFDILRFNLDQRMRGNRAPMHIGLHSDNYTSEKDDEFPNSGGARARQVAIEQFIEYAITTYPEVRFATPHQIIGWMESPVALTI
jgi:hypothetical protein